MGTTLSFRVADQETAPVPSGAFEQGNIFIVCRGAIGNSPAMFQNFLFVFFAGGCQSSQVSEGNSEIISKLR